MSDVTQLLSRIGSGDLSASDELLPLVYDELRKLAAAKLAKEPPGQTLQATALVHEAYLRLVKPVDVQKWDSCGHFFSAAAEAMRRILIDRARHNRRSRHGGAHRRAELVDVADRASQHEEEMIAVHDVLDELARQNPAAADVVKLRYFGGFTNDEVARLLQISLSTVKRRWDFARAWIYCRFPPAVADCPTD